MYLSVIHVEPRDNYQLLLEFENNEKRLLDVSPYMTEGKYKELKDVRLFNTVRVCFDSIQWANHLDLDPEFLYQKSSPIDN